MPETDPDFKLTHEKLIKAVKIILYKVNIQQKRLEVRNKENLQEL